MITRHSRSLLPLCTLVFAIACGGDSSGPPAVATVAVTSPATDIIVGQTVQLAWTVRDAKGNPLTNRVVTWSTSSAAIASVSSTGLVTGVGAGSATITATADGKTGSLSVNVVPPPVATVTVTAALNSIQAGQTTQVTAVTRDAGNNVLTGRNVTWTTSDGAIATVSGSGLVTGVAAGSVTITATSEGKTASVQIAVSPVVPGNAPQIATVTPNPMVEGQPATITGSNFGATVAGNVVRVDGVPASVTAASATSLQIIVPTLNCKPAQNVNVDVSAGGVTGAPKSQPFRPAATFTLAQGQQRIIATAADFCLQFAAAAGAESYLIGVQSVSENVTSVTPAQVTAEVPAGAAVASSSASRLFATPSLSAGLIDPLGNARSLRMAKHRAEEMRILTEERAFLQPRLRSLGRARRSVQAASVSSATVPTVPAGAKVGDVLNIRVPDRNANTCLNFIPVAATVKAVGTHSIFLEDNGNPAGGFSAADYQTLSNAFDNQIYPTDAGYFGTPTDGDGNGRIVIVITKEINKVPNLLGVVYSANFAPQSQCASSNEGEFFYGKAPDPSGTSGAAYAVADALEDAPVIIGHEFAHVIQIGRRLEYDLATEFQSVWELEGQATFAEEVNGYTVTGLAPGQNLGFAVAFNNPKITPTDWFVDGFIDLAVYYGFQSATSKAPNAPEQCSWLALRSSGNDGPCLSGREVYGVPWSFLRWISDQFGPAFPGGEKGLHQRLVENAFTGFATISDVVGVPIDVLLSQWAAALYVDDRVPGADPKLTFKSWNLQNVESRLVASARLTPRDRPFGAFTDQVSVRGGSTAYFVVSGAGRGPTGIRVRDTADGQLPGVMRLWVVRMQ